MPTMYVIFKLKMLKYMIFTILRSKTTELSKGYKHQNDILIYPKFE